jgi:hypothetical protein
MRYDRVLKQINEFSSFSKHWFQDINTKKCLRYGDSYNFIMMIIDADDMTLNV